MELEGCILTGPSKIERLFDGHGIDGASVVIRDSVVLTLLLCVLS
jgi:hypothetical protein